MIRAPAAVEFNLTLHLDEALWKCAISLCLCDVLQLHAYGNRCANLPSERLLYLETLLCPDYPLMVSSFSASQLLTTFECRLSDCDGNVFNCVLNPAVLIFE